jgi:hypothetical protein
MPAFFALIPWKYVALVTAALFAFWFVRNMGVLAERDRWEAATAVEVARQAEIASDAQRASALAAVRLMASEDARTELMRRLRDAAKRSPNAGRECLDVDSVMRLNSLRNNTPPE